MSSFSAAQLSELQQTLEQVKIGLQIEIVAVRDLVGKLGEGAQLKLSTLEESMAKHDTELHRAADEARARVIEINSTKDQVTTIVGELQKEFDARRGQTGEIDTKLQALSDAMTAHADDQAQKIGAADTAFNALNVKIEEAIGAVRKDAMDEFTTQRDLLHMTVKGFQAKFGNGEGYIPEPRRGEESDKGSRVDKKDLAVWKLPDSLDKAAFRHWLDAVGIQLEMVHKWKHADYVLNRVKRSDTEISPEVLTKCIVEANLDIEKVEGFEELGTDSSDYCFAEKSKFLYAYLVSKLNTDLHDKTVGVEHKNGLEMYRQICQIVDAIPENAPFFMNAELQNLAKTYGSKVHDLKSLYGFSLLLKRKNAEYKKIVGVEPDDGQSKLIIWNVLDPTSRLQAATDRVSMMSYKGIVAWIDLRYKVTYGNLDYKPTGKDDPMGLSMVDEPLQASQASSAPGPVGQAPWTAQEVDSAMLDYTGKGKG